MKWSERQVNQLKALAFAGTPNVEIARQTGVSISDVYAKRSQLGITIDKVRASKAKIVNPEFEAALPSIKKSSMQKRTPGKITHDLWLQFRALSTVLGEISALTVELFDTLDLLEDTEE